MRVVECQADGAFLSRKDGFLVVTKGSEEIGRVPWNDISALILSQRWGGISKDVLSECAERGVPLVSTDRNLRPTSICWPTEGHHLHSDIADMQRRATSAQEGGVWKQIVSSKIAHQASVLDWDGQKHPLSRISQRVKRGDPENLEARAAAIYWPRLMGLDFIRDPDGPDPNGGLNYGYTILRAAMARAVWASGLLPPFGIHHCGKTDPWRLVDDLMEPFRPLVDACIRKRLNRSPASVDAGMKRQLSSLLQHKIRVENKNRRVDESMQLLARSYVSFLRGSVSELTLPAPLTPIELEGLPA